jgi:hypothetical protein
MKKGHPSREKDRWEHALRCPLRGIRFEMLELIRMDLFEYLDVLTTCPYDDKRANKECTNDLLRVAFAAGHRPMSQTSSVAQDVATWIPIWNTGWIARYNLRE